MFCSNCVNILTVSVVHVADIKSFIRSSNLVVTSVCIPVTGCSLTCCLSTNLGTKWIQQF